jgi:hypothetical protein
LKNQVSKATTAAITGRTRFAEAVKPRAQAVRPWDTNARQNATKAVMFGEGGKKVTASISMNVEIFTTQYKLRNRPVE